MDINPSVFMYMYHRDTLAAWVWALEKPGRMDNGGGGPIPHPVRVPTLLYPPKFLPSPCTVRVKNLHCVPVMAEAGSRISAVLHYTVLSTNLSTIIPCTQVGHPHKPQLAEPPKKQE